MFALPTFLGVSSLFYRFSTTWIIIAVYLLLIFLLMDFLRLFLPMQNVLNGNWLTLGILTLVLTGIFTYGHILYKNTKRVELSIAVSAKDFTHLRIVAISDLHLGFNIGKAELDEWIKLINDENPDIVLMAGDIKDNSMRPLVEQDMAQSLRNLRATYGVYACTGNHEYVGNANESVPFTDFFREANITLLRDSATLINNMFYIIGREDASQPYRKSLADILQSLDRTKPLILLDHQPVNLGEAEKSGIDFQFSGHTHRGQIFPLSWITDLMFEISHGYRKKSNTHIYVSSGIGIWGGKFRIGSQSEYVVIDMKQDSFNIKQS
jgi:predicted MPP superfamily phosphohydrolase